MTETENTTEKPHCSICGKKYEAWTTVINVCIDCCVNIHDMVYEKLVAIDIRIKDKYRITDITNKPIKHCRCRSSDIIPFDYFTPFNDERKKHFLVLTGLCRSCEGYKILKLDDVEFDFMVKKTPNHLGLHINGKKLNLQFYA